MSLCAIIKISEFHENPKNAVSSVLASKDRFKELHIISPAYVEGEDIYIGWKNDKVKLEAYMTVTVESVINIDTITSQYVIYINPYCSVSLSAIELLQRDAKLSNQNETFFGLASGVKINKTSLWNGFFIVMAFIYFVWAKWENYKFFTNVDVTMQAIIQKGKKRYIPKRSTFIKYLQSPDVRKRINPIDIQMCMTESDQSPFDHLWWTIRTNKLFDFGWFWAIPILKPWMYFVGTLWATSVATCGIFVKAALYQIGISSVNQYNQSILLIPLLVLLMFWSAVWICAVYATSRLYKFKWALQMSLMMPVYVLGLPFVILYSWLIKP
jgi:hypothetical protein